MWNVSDCLEKHDINRMYPFYYYFHYYYYHYSYYYMYYTQLQRKMHKLPYTHTRSEWLIYNWTTALNKKDIRHKQMSINLLHSNTQVQHSARKSYPIVFFTSEQWLMWYNYNFWSLQVCEKEGNRVRKKGWEILQRFLFSTWIILIKKHFVV